MINNRLVFIDPTHKYFRVDEPNRKWVSGTSIVKAYTNPFKTEQWLDYKAIPHIIGEDAFDAVKLECRQRVGGFNYDEVMRVSLPLVSVEAFEEARIAIQAEWSAEGDVSSKKGTAGHLVKENASYDKGFETNIITGKECVVHPRREFEYDNEQFVESLYDLEDGYYPELIVWYEDVVGYDEDGEPILIGYCGQGDGVFIRTEGKRRIATVRDYKFVKQKKMNRGNYCAIDRGPQMMLNGLDHLASSKIGGYELQLSIYGRMLQWAGFEIDGMWLDHYNEKGKYKPIVVDYLERDAEFAILNFKNI